MRHNMLLFSSLHSKSKTSIICTIFNPSYSTVLYSFALLHPLGKLSHKEVQNIIFTVHQIASGSFYSQIHHLSKQTHHLSSSSNSNIVQYNNRIVCNIDGLNKRDP